MQGEDMTSVSFSAPVPEVKMNGVVFHIAHSHPEYLRSGDILNPTAILTSLIRDIRLFSHELDESSNFTKIL